MTAKRKSPYTVLSAGEEFYGQTFDLAVDRHGQFYALDPETGEPVDGLHSSETMTAVRDKLDRKFKTKKVRVAIEASMVLKAGLGRGFEMQRVIFTGVDAGTRKLRYTRTIYGTKTSSETMDAYGNDNVFRPLTVDEGSDYGRLVVGVEKAQLALKTWRHEHALTHKNLTSFIEDAIEKAAEGRTRS